MFVKNYLGLWVGGTRAPALPLPDPPLFRGLVSLTADAVTQIKTSWRSLSFEVHCRSVSSAFIHETDAVFWS